MSDREGRDRRVRVNRGVKNGMSEEVGQCSEF